MDCDEEDYAGGMEQAELGDLFDNSDWGDDSESWENDGASEPGDPNGDLADYTMEQESQFTESYGEGDFVGDVQDGMMDVGSEQSEATAGEQGWTADDSEGGGMDESMFDKAIGGAADLAKSGMDLVTDVASGVIDVASSVAQGAIDVASGVLDVADAISQKAVGAAGSIASAALDAFIPSSPQA